MRFTTAQIRNLVVNPEKYMRDIQSPPSRQSHGNPQRAWMESAWRAYYEHSRDESVLWDAFWTKVNAKPPSNYRSGLANGAVPLLDQFLEWDSGEHRQPSVLFPTTPDVDWNGHTLAIKRDLIFILEAGGYSLRLFWTDRQMPIAHQNAGMLAAAAFIHSEGDLGANRIAEVEVWQLRQRVRRVWNRNHLLQEAERLLANINYISDSINY